MTWLEFQEPQQSKGLVRRRTGNPKKLRTETVGAGAPRACLKRVGLSYCWFPLGHSGACRPGINR